MLKKIFREYPERIRKSWRFLREGQIDLPNAMSVVRCNRNAVGNCWKFLKIVRCSSAGVSRPASFYSIHSVKRHALCRLESQTSAARPR